MENIHVSQLIMYLAATMIQNLSIRRQFGIRAKVCFHLYVGRIKGCLQKELDELDDYA
ncbi:unnamed protein product [Dovyalis caffra]|uniref:Uncharacterized protein n=1 Tax=Dovyalis caffra TaxID=77055 RepID=A0AAV1R5W1_9ROSI|nr:unnamed protein product [Dovyalis caffra]